MRIKPMANPGRTSRASARRTRSRARTRRTARTCSRRRARPCSSGKAKPEIFAMGVRNLYSIDVDPKTDKVAAAWVGPDQGTNTTTWGPAKTENAVLINSAGNYGWPYCTGNKQGYRAKLPRDHRRRRRGAARSPGHGRRRRRRPDAAATGTATTRRASSTTRRTTTASSGSRRRARPTSGTARRAAATTSRATPTASRSTPRLEHERPTPDSFRRCPFALRRRPGADDGRHLPQARRRQARTRWPAYWDGRWFIARLLRREQHPSRPAHGSGDGVHGRPADRGGLAVRHHPAVAARQ